MNIKKNHFLSATLCFAFVALTACGEGKKKEKEENAKEETEMKESAEAKEQQQSTIAELAMGTESLSTLVTALKSAELAAMFNEPGEYTVFAPTNEAFGKLPDGTVESLLKPENKEALQGVLKYHVVASEVKAGDLLKNIKSNDGSFTFSTVAGADITAMLKDGNVVLEDGAGNTAQVVKTDIDASNGVVHVIDNVVMAE